MRVILLNAAPWQINPKAPQNYYGYSIRILESPKPKSLLHHNGITLIDNCDKIFSKLGLTDVRIIVNYKKEEIEEHIENNNLNIKTVYNPYWEHPANSIELGAKDTEEDILILFGDVWFTEGAIKFLIDSDAPYSTIYSANPEGVERGYWHGAKVKKDYIDEFIETYRSMFKSDIKAYKVKDVFEKLGENMHFDNELQDFDIYERTEDFAKSQVVGYAFMVADLIHIGHLRFLQECKRHCDVLIVGVYTDKLTESYKRKPIITFEQRVEMIKFIPYVDNVLAIGGRSCISAIKFIESAGLRVGVLFHGDDWNAETNEYLKEAKEYLESYGGKLIQPKYTEEVSSTMIIDRIISRYLEEEGLK